MIVAVKTSTKIDSLQAIRAFAAIFVMLFHGTEILHERLGYLFLNNIFNAGFSGVDIFFVLSGFIILHTSSVGKNNIVNFIKKRFIRIYPVYWLITVLLIVLFFISPTADQSYKGEFDVIVGSFLLIPQKQYVVGVAWTLAYEVIFYLVFAATFFRNPKFLLYAFASWVVIILIFYFFNIKTGFFAIDSLTRPVILNFALGCMVAFLYKQYPNFRNSGWIFWGAMLLFLLTWSIFYQIKASNSTAFTGDMARVYLFGIPASFMIFGALYLTVAIPRILVFLGDASYSIYLLHGTVLSLLIKIIFKLKLSTMFSSFEGAITLFILTLVISCLFYSIVERKILKLFNKLIK